MKKSELLALRVGETFTQDGMVWLRVEDLEHFHFENEFVCTFDPCGILTGQMVHYSFFVTYWDD